jgi:hypothetical protein
MTAFHDLRGAFAATQAWAPDDEPPAQPTPSPDDAAPDDVAGEGDGQGSGTGEPPENPELKKLHDEAARHRVRAKDAEAKADALADQVRTLTIRLAFNTLAGDANLTDLDAAWKLAADDLRAVQVGEDGTVDTDRLGQIVAHVAERYPYLTTAPAPAKTPTDAFPPSLASGRPTNTRKRDRSHLDAGYLEAKFPALARRRR